MASSALDDVIEDNQIAGLILNSSALIDYKRMLWRVWNQVCDCHPGLSLSAEEFRTQVLECSHYSPQEVIRYIVDNSPNPAATEQMGVLLAYTKYYDRALVDYAHDIVRIEAVFSVIRRYYKSIPMAVISTNSHEDVVQLLTSVGALHLFDVVVAQQSGEKRNLSDMFSVAAQSLNQPCSLCLGVDVLDANMELMAEKGKVMFDAKTLPGYESPLFSPTNSDVTGKKAVALGQSLSIGSTLALILIVTIMGISMGGHDINFSL